MERFFNEYPILGCILVASVLMVSAFLDRIARARAVAYFNWWLGGVLAVGSISCDVAIHGSFLGIFRWPAVVICFIVGFYAVWAFFRRFRDDSDESKR